MNWNQIEGKWLQFQGQANQQWGKLTDDEIARLSGNRDELVGRLQELYGISEEEADKQVAGWQQNLS